ncbi:MAG: hypothetical protein LBT35_01785 [Tannerella sp.]|jgi:hypothetical protein|nr:hypothetical protein [Tannerella sp.]
MKNLTIIGLVMLAGMSSCNEERVEYTSRVNDFKALQAEFAKPSKEYGSAPLYVWNTKVTRELIDNSMKELKDKGFGGVFIHPRPGMITEYLSDDWYDLYNYTISKGKELDMNVWIYDENSYPSGFAGGHVPDQMPESYNQGQGLTMEKLTQIPDNLNPEWFIILKKDGSRYSDITSTAKAEAGKTGDYFAFRKTYYGRSPWYGGFSYVDLLLPGVTEKFIEITMDGYKQRIGEEFGKTVPGWFTDEPNINPPGGIRWTPDLFDVFEARWGYDLKANLPALYEETGDWKTVRHNYQQVLLQLFIDRWSKPCFEYCEANNLKFTGHYWEHGWPALADGPDNMAMYAWHQMPAIDMLFNQYNDVSPQAQFGNARSVKELRSVANQMGSNRTLSETYGGGGWDETFRDFKRLGDWEYALGVNFMNQHIADLSIAGARKYDYPPVFSIHSPWWNSYRTLNVYFARLSMALSAGEQVNNILVLEPTTSVWLYYAFGKSNPQYMEIGRTFQKFVTALEKKQVEYDLASENILKDQGRINGNRFVVGKRTYNNVVIPPATENLDAATFALLKDYAAKGGKITAYSKPEYLDGAVNDEIKSFFNDADKVSFVASAETFDIESSKIAFTVAKGNDLYHQRREMKDGQILFLVNSSLTETAAGSLQIVGKDAVELNTLAGEINDYPETATKDGKIELAYELAPAGSLLLYICDSKQSGFNLSEKIDYNSVVAGTAEEIRPMEDNVLTVDFCDLTLGGETFRDIHLFPAADMVFKHHGFSDGNPWNTSVQFGNSTLARDTFTTGGFTAAYRFTVKDNFDMSDIKAVVERASLYTVRINGAEVKAESGKWWLDPEMNVIHIGKYVKKGENILSLTVSPMKILAEIEQVFILGNFRVVPASKGFEIVAPVAGFTADSWKSQGYPFYSRAFAYSRKFNIDDLQARYAVALGEWQGTVSEVYVNGQSAGIIAFEPYVLDVSKILKKGENIVEVRVTGSNQNLLGPFHKDTKGLVSPWDFRNVKEYPAGEAYRQKDYGLTGGLELIIDN